MGGQFFNFSVRASNVQETTVLDAITTKLSCIGGACGYSYDCPRSPEEGDAIVQTRYGAFEIRLVNTRGMGNYGAFIVVALEQSSYDFQLRETLKQLETRRLAFDGDAREKFVECLLAVCHSPVAAGGRWVGELNGYNYFAYGNSNYRNVGDDTFRVWALKVGEVSPRKAAKMTEEAAKKEAREAASRRAQLLNKARQASSHKSLATLGEIIGKL